jgi:hypothetical protein
LWLHIQLSPSFTTSSSCLFLPPRKPDPARCGPILGQECCVSTSCMDSGHRGGSVGSADVAQRRCHLPYLHPHPLLSHWEVMMRRTRRWESPPPLSSPPCHCPCPGPRKKAILGGTPVVSILIPAPSLGSEIQGGTELEGQQNAEDSKPRNKRQSPRQGVRDREKERPKDIPKRWIGRNATQSVVQIISRHI